MSTIIDARVRLPLELRPPEHEEQARQFHSQYDIVLNLSEKRHKTLADLKEEMGAANISHAIIHAEYEYGDYADQLNEAVATIVHEEPALFSGFGSISLANISPKRARMQLETVKELGLLGINIQPAFFNMAIDDKLLYPVYAKAEELGLIVAIHTGINYSRTHPIKYGHPLLLDQIACHFSDLTLIACHASWPWIPEIVAIARKHPNIMIEFGGLAPKYIGQPGSGWEVMRRFMNSLLQEQILFATDWPVISMERAVREWVDLGLKQETLENAFAKNIKRLISRKR